MKSLKNPRHHQIPTGVAASAATSDRFSKSPKSQRAILVFHAFVKKTQQTPATEMLLGRKRLKEMLSNEKK
jgi:hypothetical protein